MILKNREKKTLKSYCDGYKRNLVFCRMLCGYVPNHLELIINTMFSKDIRKVSDDIVLEKYKDIYNFGLEAYCIIEPDKTKYYEIIKALIRQNVIVIIYKNSEEYQKDMKKISEQLI